MKKIYIAAGCFLLTATILSCKKDKSEYLAETVDNATCNITEDEFNGWFASGKAAENGIVVNANSVDFAHNNNCDFYKWSEQMFLWITSHVEGQTVMESPTFYTISPKDAKNKRHLVLHEKGKLLRAMANVHKTGKINSEEGQATDDVLMDRNGNLVYYISMANDVYAEFLTASKNKKMNGKTFPTTQQEMDSIIKFAKVNGVVLQDSTALAMEIKTSWVVAESLPNPEDFITITAIIPTYKKTGSLWVIEDEREAKLAMVGMHIVGSTAGHPEMIWATFEHKQNAPNLEYQYVNKEGETETVAADGDGNWLLNNNVKESANVSHMTFSGDSIIANKGFTISPSNTTRTKPWGSSYDVQPNAEDANPALANTKVMEISKAVAKLLPGKDVRKNYIFIGATWTDGGAGPNGYSYSPNESEPGVAIGSSQLANSTMETYAQNGADYNEFGTCFSCHSNNNGLKPTDLSHVYADIIPLNEADMKQPVRKHK